MDDPLFFLSSSPFLDEEFYWASSPASENLDFHILPSVPSPPPEQKRSAFVKYSGREKNCNYADSLISDNIHKRVIGMLTRINNYKRSNNDNTNNNGDQQGNNSEGVEMMMTVKEGSRGFRHMMRERQRREKLSQSYADLYAVISSRSKHDKNSIVRSAAIYLKELKQAKEELKKRNDELKAGLVADNVQIGTKIRLQVNEPASAIDSMIAALQCLKNMNVKTNSVQSSYSDDCQLSALITIDTKVEASEVERAVGKALTEVEEKLRSNHPRNFQFPHVQNVLS